MDVQWLNQGGPIAIPLLLSSIVSLTLFVERWLSYRLYYAIRRQDSLMIEHFCAEKDVKGLQKWMVQGDSSVNAMVQVLMFQWNAGASPRVIRDRLEEWAGQLNAKLERGLEALAVIASVAPMLGLMGTVLGMVVTFEAIQEHGLGNADVLAGGISQALLTTLFGLAVGIPTLIAHRILIKMVDGRLLELQRLASLVLDVLIEMGDSRTVVVPEKSE